MLSKRTPYLSGNSALWVTPMRHPKEEFQKGEWQLNIPLTIKTLMLDHPTLNSINIWILLQAYIVISHPHSTTVRRMIRAPSPVIPTPTRCFCIRRRTLVTDRLLQPTPQGRLCIRIRRN